MVSNNTESVKCLMVGAKGIGKTTFLKQYPNSKLVSSESIETYRINCLNEFKNKSKSFEYLDIEIANYDITADTLFVCNQTELLETSEKIINTNNYKVIILCFAMDDLASFELIKQKWKFYLKTANLAHNIILIGLKSDKISSCIKQLGTCKERSSSISSNSSTSKLHLNRMRLRTLSDSDSNYTHSLLADFKKFAKKISQFKLIQSSSIEHSVDLFKSTKNSIESYANLSKSICKCNMRKTSETNNSTNTNTNNNTKNKLNKLPRALTAPINYLATHRSRKPLDEKKLTESVAFDKNDEKLTITKLKPETSNLTIKKKISQLFIGLGTYLVTCGTGKSRRLLLTNNNTNHRHHQSKINIIKSKTNLIKKDKSWLLLSSEVSLNNLENDDVFLN